MAAAGGGDDGRDYFGQPRGAPLRATGDKAAYSHRKRIGLLAANAIERRERCWLSRLFTFTTTSHDLRHVSALRYITMATLARRARRPRRCHIALHAGRHIRMPAKC